MMKRGEVLSDSIRENSMPTRLRLLARADVDVVEHLEVVREELDWRYQHVADCLASRSCGITSAKSGFSHSSGVWPALW